MKLDHKIFDILHTINLPIRKGLSYTPKDLMDEDYYEIDFDVKLSDGYNLQRPLVWSYVQKSELILSILKGIQLPNLSVIMSETEEYVTKVSNKKLLKVIDGKQRLSTIFEFIRGEFNIYIPELEEALPSFSFRELDEKLQRRILNAHLRLDIVYEHPADPESIVSDIELIKWFRLINFSGTEQEAAHNFHLNRRLSTLVYERNQQTTHKR
ncbi:gp118 [Sphingomonas phage PAU]|uniref:gp118 n=1 Tax=Sphingomonas phage PAU TaxID=1150991 RepID=UPI0002573269|nr:gp118 [Sphingomonas phage PAU]AFF28116.1 gp118 [Sphingomonas phage PAU]